MSDTPANIVSFVKRADGEFYTISEVARQVGRSEDAIKAWMDSGKVNRPSHRMPLGTKGFVWLYTREDIESYKQCAASQHPGRPKKTGPDAG